MAWRPHGRAEVNPDSPRAWASCDSCGFNYNLYKLRYQYKYAGSSLINTGFLVCETCLDLPNPQFKTIVLPPDPKPIFNPRPEPYSIDETQVRMVQDGEPRITEDEEEYRLPDNSVNDAGIIAPQVQYLTTLIPMVSTAEFNITQQATDFTLVYGADFLVWGSDSLVWG